VPTDDKSVQAGLDRLREKLREHDKPLATATAKGPDPLNRDPREGIVVMFRKDIAGAEEAIRELASDVAPGVPLHLCPAGPARAQGS
jgi:hypothetical protein